MKKSGKKKSAKVSSRKASKQKQSSTKFAQVGSPKEVKQKGGYLVQIENTTRDVNGIVTSSEFVQYVGSKRQPLTLQKAENVRDGLKAIGSGGRILNVPEMTEHEKWESLATLEAASKAENMSQNKATESVEPGSQTPPPLRSRPNPLAKKKVLDIKIGVSYNYCCTGYCQSRVPV